MGLSVLMFLVTFVFPFSSCFASFTPADSDGAAASLPLHNPGMISLAVIFSFFALAVLSLLVSHKLRRRTLKGVPYE